jgi:hypothetical protein
MIDRQSFFGSVRKSLFGNKLSQSQVDGMEAILSAAPKNMDLRHLAYCLATTYHETGPMTKHGHMQPIREGGGPTYFRRMYDIAGDRPHVARALGNTQFGDGAKFHGRGYVQLTGKTNYDRAGKKINVDLIASPDKALDPANAARIMFEGMKAGWFTGKKLADYDGLQGGYDAHNARRIINGTDKADLIAGYYKHFHAALNMALRADVIPPPPDVEPVPPTTPQPSFWARLWAFFSRPA